MTSQDETLDQSHDGVAVEASGPSPKKRETTEDPTVKKLRLEREATELVASLNDGVFSDLKTKVAWVLNMYPHTRDSDESSRHVQNGT
jgi:hypothetical protein